MKIVKSLAICAVSLVMFASQAFATSAWYTCNVTRAGITNYSDVAVAYLTDTAGTPAFTAKPFKFASTTVNAQLATALSASSSGKTVYVYADPTGSIGQIYNIYMNTN